MTYISNIYIFPLITLRDIISINGLTLLVTLLVSVTSNTLWHYWFKHWC